MGQVHLPLKHAIYVSVASSDYRKTSAQEARPWRPSWRDALPLADPGENLISEPRKGLGRPSQPPLSAEGGTKFLKETIHLASARRAVLVTSS
jgi:hypothetical protein